MNRLEKSAFPLRLVLIFALLSAGIAVSGFLYYQEQNRTIRSQRNDELRAIADLKVSQIESWRRERLADGTYIRENPFVLQAFGRLLNGVPSPQLERTVLVWMSEYKQRHGYSNLILLDAKGVVRLSTLAATHPMEPENLSLAALAMQSRAVILSDLHRDAAKAINMDLCVPISSPERAAPLGALLIEIDPRQSLYPLIGNWPTPSKTAETLLLRREGNEVLFLNDLRHRKETALSFRLPFGRTVLPVVKPRPGAIGESHDYRGVAVVAAARTISDSPWILVAKMDRDEIYGPLRQSALSTGLLAFFLFVAAATSVLLLWREQQGRFYRRQHASEIEQRVLVERLDVLSRYANDIILLADPSGQILDANERALLSYGYERQELLRFTMSELLPPDARPDFGPRWARLMEEGGLVLEARHQRKDLSAFPVEISARLIAFEGNMCCQSIIRDISERKTAEEQLRLLESATLQTSDGVLIVGVAGEDACCQDPVFVNPAFEQITGYGLEDLRKGAVRHLYQSGANPHSIEGRDHGFRERCPKQLEQLAVRKDGSQFWAEWRFSPLARKDGIYTHCVWICRDITERKRAEESSRFLSSIVESSDDAIIGENMEGTVLSWNKGAERIYGYSAGEMVGRPISILVPSQRLDEFPEMMEVLRHGQSIEHFETERVRKDGRCMFVSITVSPVKDGANQVIGASVIARDISERKRAGEQLAEAHRKNTAVLESISDGFNAFDREWCYTYVNAAGAKMVGKTPEELLGRNVWELWPHAADSPFGVAYRRAVAENVQVQVEAFYPEPLNRWFEVRCYPSPEGLTLFFTDTTERKRTEKALQLSEERYRSLALATTQILWTTNPQGEVVDDMPVWRTFTGQSLGEIEGRGWIEALHPDDRERTTDLLSRALRTRSFYNTEYRLRRLDGEYRWMAVHGVPVLEEDGVVREWVGTCADITERKQAEEEIRNLNQELEQRVVERTAQWAASNEELEAFAYSVSHDLRAPLRAVDGFSKILLEEYAPELSPEAQHYLQAAHQNAVQMGELIDGLLKFSWLNRQPLSKQSIAPADLVRQAWEDLRVERNGRQVEINVGDLPPCQGDALLLKQVFANLLSNALKYTRKRDIARIEVGSSSGIGLPACNSPVYFVRDNGVGFDMRYRHKLFGVFQRLHLAEDYEGTGVGLATVQRIVHRHGGQVWANAVLNQGATFYFTVSNGGKPTERNGNHVG